MAILNETACYASEFLKSEGNGEISRQNVVVVSATPIAAGTVLGKITASGKFAAYDNAASDGTQVAAGVLFAPLAGNATGEPGVAIVRDAEVYASKLTGEDAPALADLAALGVIVR